jgi:deoxyribonuclease-4
MIGVHIQNPELQKREIEKSDIVQIFANNVNNKFLKNKKIVIHANYTINFAKDWDENSPWIQEAINTINIANSINAYGVVFHLGKQMKLTKQEAYNNMYMSIIYVLSMTKKCKNVKILIETVAGQGSEMCSKIEDLGYFVKKFHKVTGIKNRLFVCIDTCHLFAAGYELDEDFFIKFDKLIGIKRIKLVHLNNSKNIKNSHVDRHDGLFVGKIDTVVLKRVKKYFQGLKVPIIIESPSKYLLEDLNI